MVVKTGAANVEKLAWTILDVNWSQYKYDTDLDSHLHRTLIRQEEMRNLSEEFNKLADSRQVKTAGVFMPLLPLVLPFAKCSSQAFGL
jgi:hypothetical protein